MKWFDKWFYKQAKKAWENKDQYEEHGNYVEEMKRTIKMGTASIAGLQKSAVEGDNRISFELSSAVGGKILNVRHYDPRSDRHESQTYVIPTGEDIGERVAKIINLEMFKQ